jgi:hypothetical protein
MYIQLSTCHLVASDLAEDFFQANSINYAFWKADSQPNHLFHIFPCRDMYGDNAPSRQPERTNEAAGTYAQACISVAKELDHPVIDIWTQMQQFPDWQTSALW